jgi:lipopolysaccharide export system permease protein
MGIFLVPKASEGFKNFRYMYLIGGGQSEMRDNSDVYRQISKDEYMYVGSYNPEAKMGFKFSMEKFEGDKLKYKISAERIKFNEQDTTYSLYGFKKRDLHKFIAKEKARGSSNIDVYLTVLYKKYSVPVSAFILTIIAVAVSAMKRRGGMGMNLAIGILLAFAFVFFDKIFGVLAEKSTIPPVIAVWIPNIVFGILAVYLLRNAKR